MIPSLTRPPLINALHDKLINRALPGNNAHMAMAHAVRKADPQQGIEAFREAGVLIIIYENSPGEFKIVFIRRGAGHAEDKHAGQMAFPGGKKEEDDKDMLYAAMREAEEEIALDLSMIDILGSLTPLYIPVSKFLVHPFLAFAAKTPVLKRQESEIEEILHLPLTSFLQPDAKQTTRIKIAPQITLNHVPCFIVQNQMIWGATAMMLNELLELVVN